MSNISLIIQREFNERVRKKSFILPTEKNLGKITDHSVAGPA